MSASTIETPKVFFLGYEAESEATSTEDLARLTKEFFEAQADVELVEISSIIYADEEPAEDLALSVIDIIPDDSAPALIASEAILAGGDHPKGLQNLDFWATGHTEQRADNIGSIALVIVRMPLFKHLNGYPHDDWLREKQDRTVLHPITRYDPESWPVAQEVLNLGVTTTSEIDMKPPAPAYRPYIADNTPNTAAQQRVHLPTQPEINLLETEDYRWLQGSAA